MKELMFKTGLGEETTTALLVSCSTPICVSYLTLKLHSHAVQELISREMMGLINVIEETVFLATHNAVGLQTKRLPMPCFNLPLSAMTAGLPTITNHFLLHSASRGKWQLQMAGTIFRSSRCPVSQQNHRLLHHQHLRRSIPRQCQQLHRLNRQQHRRRPGRLNRQLLHFHPHQVAMMLTL